MTSTAFAVLAGALTVLNPCGIAMLPVLVSMTRTADSTERRSSIAHALGIGLLMSAGGVAGFGVFALPIGLGAQQLTDALPWVGLVLGLAMTLAAVLVLAGRRIALLDPRIQISDQPGKRGVLVGGVGYGLASLGCGLPLFLIAVGAASTGDSRLAVVGVIVAYAGGMAAAFVAVAVGSVWVRHRTQPALDGLRGRLRWLNGGLLLLAGGYLTYYWSTLLFASVDTRSRDPVTTTVERSGRWLQQAATTGAAQLMPIALVIAVAAGILWWLWRWAQIRDTPPPGTAPTGQLHWGDCGCAESATPLAGTAAGRRDRAADVSQTRPPA